MATEHSDDSVYYVPHSSHAPIVTAFGIFGFAHISQNDLTTPPYTQNFFSNTLTFAIKNPTIDHNIGSTLCKINGCGGSNSASSTCY